MWAIVYGAVVAAIVGTILAVVGAAGVGLVTYAGIETLLATLRVAINAELAGIPSDMMNIAGLLGVDIAIKIILSSITAGLTAGGIFGGIRFLRRAG
jgi:hypothetical protein